MSVGILRTHVIVHGVVQGVGFRYFAMDLARRHRVAGWVRNRPNGTVEAEIEGPPSVVRAYLADLHVGPRSAKVSALDVTEIPEAAGYTDFTLRF